MFKAFLLKIQILLSIQPVLAQNKLLFSVNKIKRMITSLSSFLYGPQWTRTTDLTLISANQSFHRIVNLLLYLRLKHFCKVGKTQKNYIKLHNSP